MVIEAGPGTPYALLRFACMPPPSPSSAVPPVPSTASPAPVRLLVATNNPHKIAELGAILAGLPVTLVTPGEIGLDLDVEETGQTLEENAILKATAFARASGLPALADDSGLEVDALGGDPGVRSRRYAGEHASDEMRIALLLERLRGVPEAQRTARFRCVMALATAEGLVGTVQGTCEGRIAGAPRGRHGFGYDPIFWLPERGQTMAELTPEEKNQISHRARAGAAARRLIEAWLARAGQGTGGEARALADQGMGGAARALADRADATGVPAPAPHRGAGGEPRGAGGARPGAEG